MGMATTAKAEGAPSGGMPPSSDSTEPRTTGSQPALQDPSVPGTPNVTTSHNVTMSPVSPEAGSQAPGHATALPSTTKPGVSPLVVSTSFQVTGQTSPKSPEGQQHSVSTGSPVPVTDSSFSTPRGMPTTLTPLANSSETQQTPSSVPTSPASPSFLSPSSASPSSLAPQPSSPSWGTEAATSGGPTSSSSKTALTSQHWPSTPLPTSVVRDNRVSCGPPEGLTKHLLVLNLTRSSPCTESLPEDTLVTLLCQAAKPTFNSTQDQCHVKLAPVLGSQVVAVKEITIKTNLLPHAVFELLKDRWEDLKEEGVRDMQLGEQGPPEEAEDRFSLPLIITIVCMASFLLLVAALYGCCHQRLSHRKDQQRLTEELQTVENGYHDNPTLEVMETSAEMQEKKVVSLNGELGDSWIVPLDNLTKDDLDEEDTHL